MATRGRPKGRAWGSPAPPVARAAPERAAGDKARASPDAGYLAGMEPSQQEPHARLLFVLMSAVVSRGPPRAQQSLTVFSGHACARHRQGRLAL